MSRAILLTLAAAALSFLAAGFAFAADGKDKDSAPYEYETCRLNGVESLKISNLGSVTVTETKQSSYNNESEWDLRNAKGLKKSSLTLKEGEEFQATCDKWIKYIYKIEKVDEDFVIVTVTNKKTKSQKREESHTVKVKPY